MKTKNFIEIKSLNDNDFDKMDRYNLAVVLQSFIS